MLANQRCDRPGLPRHRRGNGLHPRHNRVDRVGGQARQAEPTVGTHLHQRVVARIGGAAAPGHKPGTQQFAAAGQVHGGIGQHGDVLAAQDHANPQILTAGTEPALPDKHHLLAVIAVDLAVHRAAKRHHQALATRRREAARQQLHALAARAANIDQPQRSAYHAPLDNVCGTQLQVAEHRIRQRCIGAADTADGQRAQGVKIQAKGNGG